MTQDFKVKDLKLAEFGNKEISLQNKLPIRILVYRSNYKTDHFVIPDAYCGH